MQINTMQTVADPNREDIATQLKKFSAFRSWSQIDLNDLAQRIIVREFHTDELLVEERSTGDYLYLVESGSLRESGVDSEGKIWWDRTHDTGATFSRQASYGGVYQETEVKALTTGRLFVVTPADLAWALTRKADLRETLTLEGLSSRLRAVPLFSPLDDQQIRRLATIARWDELNAGATICAPETTAASIWFWLIDWGQVAVTADELLDLPVITAGNFFCNASDGLGALPAVTAKAKTRVKLIRLPFDEIQLLAHNNPAIANRLASPPIHAYLRLVRQFATLTPAHFDQLTTITAWEHYPSARTVTEQGRLGNSLRILQRGAALIRATDEQGRDRPRDVLAPGSYYGGSSLFHQERHEATVRAVRADTVAGSNTLLTSAIAQGDPAHADEPGATWFRIRYEDLNFLLKSDPKFWATTALPAMMERERRTFRKYDWQEEDEVIFFDGRRHVVVLLQALLVPLALFALEVGIYALLRRFGLKLSNLSEFLVVVATVLPVAFWYVIDYFNDYFVVTNLRVTAREQVLFVYESRTEAPLDQVQDTMVTSGIIGNLLNFGDLIIKTAGNVSQVVFDRVANSRWIQQLIVDLQHRLQAERRAEQREGLRFYIVQELKLALVPRPPERALPPGTRVPIQKTWWDLILDGITKVLQFIFLPFDRLIVRPARHFAGIIAQRRLSPISVSGEFGGGVFASWWITPEKTVWRKHWVILVQRIWVALLLWFFTLAFLVSIIANLLPIPILIGVVLFSIATFRLWWKYQDWANDVYEITDSKLVDIERKPFGFSESRREGNLDRVQNVLLEIPGFLPNLLNYGNVIIKTAATDEGFTFDLVADPRAVQREIWRRLAAFRASKIRREATSQREQQAQLLGVYHELMEESGKYQNPDEMRGQKTRKNSP